ncbi:hypothetical protein [Pseudalkalibacillus hwajinpoensis]|uniref:hypothetical protein n=1 Tax=Guptibacillus hwajinpoensis TaxID=208199 RepID=UPI001CD5C160|nr:hypothetical protein [Pseudalkalibacillus hwajinpoensis]MCA0993812.1 hypothetical protein [Pseudalkalibacillus hwajinpoensis]
MGKREIADKEMLAYLRLSTPEENQVTIFFMVVVLIDFMGFFPYLIGPFSITFFVAALVPAIIINLWMIVYVLAPYKLEATFDLLVGAFSIVSAYLYWLGSEKLLYINLGIQGISAFLLGLILLLLLVTFFYFYTRYQIRLGKYKRNKHHQHHQSGLGILGSVAIIIGISQLGNFMTTTEKMDITFTIGILCLISCFTLFLIGNYHYYRFIKSNHHIIRKVYPDFSKRKKHRRMLRYYSFAVIKEDNLKREEMKAITDELGELINVFPVKKVTMEDFDQERLLEVFPVKDYESFCIVVMQDNQKRLDEEVKKMVRTKRWKYFFKGIPTEEYEKVEDRVLFDPRNAVFQSGDLSEVRSFLLSKVR